jgi:hypothetical protein
MPICRFKAADLKRLLLHANASTEFDMGHENMTDAEFESLGLSPPVDRTPIGPGLLFVHDRGVYLMSNGIPRDMDAAQTGSHVVYAEYCNPNTDTEWYDNSRELVGGDDFAEVIRIPRSWIDACEQFETFEIVINNDMLNSGFVDPIVPVTA